MVRLSRYKVKVRVNEKIYDLLFEVIGANRSKNDFLKVIFEVLSPAEQLTLGKRIAIMYLLELKIDYELIRSTLCVSTATIAKCVIILASSQEIKRTLKVLALNKKLSDGVFTLITQIYHPGVYGFNWSSAKSFQNELLRRKREGI